jgi:predicted transcriptional regulator
MAKKELMALPKLELAVMKVVWAKGRVTVYDVQGALLPERKLAYTSVASTLRILEEKGFLTHDLDGRTYIYRPLVQESDVSRSMLQDMLDRLFDGSTERLLATLFETQKIKSEELEKIQARIAAYQKEHKDE